MRAGLALHTTAKASTWRGEETSPRHARLAFATDAPIVLGFALLVVAAIAVLYIAQVRAGRDGGKVTQRSVSPTATVPLLPLAATTWGLTPHAPVVLGLTTSVRQQQALVRQPSRPLPGERPPLPRDPLKHINRSQYARFAPLCKGTIPGRPGRVAVATSPLLGSLCS